MFGNANSLPISIVLSLSHTVSGLHWNKIPDDDDNKVGARGILYLLIFQQLGQLLRWSWGYNVLLAPDLGVGEGDNTGSRPEQGNYGEPNFEEEQRLLDDTSIHSDCETSSRSNLATPANSDIKVSNRANLINQLQSRRSNSSSTETGVSEGIQSSQVGIKSTLRRTIKASSHWISTKYISAFRSLPGPFQTCLIQSGYALRRFCWGVWGSMNPPLWAMLVSIIVASVPPLQRFFFTPGTFIENSVTSAIRQGADAAVPLVLAILGANLARNTLPVDDNGESDKEETRILIASLVSRMVLPTVIMAPLVALVAKYASIGILNDPIFIIVAFLLVGAPSALQLSQICQMNNLYVKAMSRLLFHSYVIWSVILHRELTGEETDIFAGLCPQCSFSSSVL